MARLFEDLLIVNGDRTRGGAMLETHEFIEQTIEGAPAHGP